MKRKIFLLISVAFCVSLFSQKNSLLDSLINVSLESYLCKDDVIETEKIFIQIDNYPRSFVFSQKIKKLNPIYFSLINLHNQHGLFKTKVFDAIFLDIYLVNDNLSIILSKRIINLQKKKINISISDSGEYLYKYSCENNSWNLIDTKYSGI